MTAAILIRSADVVAEGRTLEGLAFRWDHPSRVQDRTGPPYLEEFVQRSADETLKTRAVMPVFVRHEHDRDPIGAVRFERSAEGLVFAAPLSRTQYADEMLELVNDGAMRSVSIGFTPVRNGGRNDRLGRVVQRLEIKLRELSLAPTGFGQHEGAQVLAIRSDQEGTPRLDALRKRMLLL